MKEKAEVKKQALKYLNLLIRLLSILISILKANNYLLINVTILNSILKIIKVPRILIKWKKTDIQYLIMLLKNMIDYQFAFLKCIH